MSVNRTVGVAWLLMTSSTLLAGPLPAQGSIEVGIAPRLAIIDPAGRLYATGMRSASDVLTFSSATLRSSPSVGAALRVGSPELGAFLHLSVDHAPGADATLVVFGQPSALPAIVTHRAVFPAALTELGASVVLPLRLELGPLRPFATAGMGLTHYRFSSPETGPPIPPDAVPPQSGTAASRRFGGGVDFDLWNRGASLSIVDSSGGYHGESVHRWTLAAELWLLLRR